MPPKPLFVILDGYSMAYRHYHGTARQNLTTSDGEPTGAIYGFTRQMLDIMFKDKPDYVAVAMDAGMSGREILYEEYKAHREPPPDDFEPQVQRIREVLNALNVPILELEGFEADDIIGTMVRSAQSQNVYSRIVTGDGDLLQLITDKTDVYLHRPFGGPKLYDRAAFHEKYSLEPPQLVDYKAMVGDSSDNIPGVRGVGDKTATPLIQEYGSLAEIYAHVDNIKGRARKKLQKQRSSAFISYELARVRCDLPLKLDLDGCVTRDFDLEKVTEIFETLDFQSLIKRLHTRDADDTPTQQTMFRELTANEVADGDFVMNDTFSAPQAAEKLVNAAAVLTEDGLQSVVDTLNDADMISFDVETTSIDPVEAELVGISVSVDGETGYYIPIAHIDTKEDQLPLDTVLNALRGPLTNPDIPKVAHNAAYDLVVMRRYGVDVTPITFDTMIAEWVRDSASNNLSLSNLAMQPGILTEAGIIMRDIKDLIGSGKNQRTFDTVPISKAAVYGAEDAGITYRLVEPLKQGLQTYDKAETLFYKLEMPLVPVIATMEQNGVLLDVDYLANLSETLQAQLDDIEAAIYANSGGYGEFNINSPKQLNEVLFDKLDLPTKGIRKTTHGYSTAAAILERLYEDTKHPILEKILEHRELTKLKGTYVDALPQLVNPETGRIHTSFNQTGTSTGRLSSSNPNLQNIPIRTEIGREVRRAFTTPEGKTLLAVDYSQVELRIMAHIADEPYLKASFADGKDIHQATAALVNDIDIDDVTSNQRAMAKRVNFGLLYGMGAHRLMRESDLTYAEAEEFIETYFARLPRVKEYIDNTKRTLFENGYVETLMGRRRYFGDIRKMSRRDRNRAEREAVNMPIQGSSADILKKAMIEVQDELRERDLGALMTLQVHDELVLEVPDDELDETAALVVEIMENTYDITPKLRANAQVGQNWRDMEPLS